MTKPAWSILPDEWKPILAERGLRAFRADQILQSLYRDCIRDWDRATTLPKDLREALTLPLKHLSAYSLTVEEGTPLSRRYAADPACDERTAAMEKLTRRVLKEAGMKQYEISNYARPGYECRHNQNVWHGETYLGLGPAACSFDGRDRFTQVSSVRAWLDGAEPETDTVPEPTRQAEMLLLGLRTIRGWAKGEFERAAGIAPEAFRSGQIAALRRKKWMKSKSLALTCRGLDFWNDAALELL